jgi:broad specificity phosphatase PhoE
MNVYFVRHGESEANAARVTQPPDSLLSEVGRRQAELVAKRFLHMPVDRIVASPFERAKETAEIIQKGIPHVPLSYSELFIEQRRPSSIIGKSYDDQDVQKTIELWKKYADDPDWKYEDEENFTDLKVRAEQALYELTTLKYDHVLVVTHGNFLRVLFSSILFGPALTVRELAAVRRTLFPSNTGVTLCQYHFEKKEWSVVTWNDLAHLAE